MDQVSAFYGDPLWGPWMFPDEDARADGLSTIMRFFASGRGLRADGGRGPRLFDRFDEHYPKDEPHYYLSLWGTHRDHAGRGLGTA